MPNARRAAVATNEKLAAAARPKREYTAPKRPRSSAADVVLDCRCGKHFETAEETDAHCHTCFALFEHILEARKAKLAARAARGGGNAGAAAAASTTANNTPSEM